MKFTRTTLRILHISLLSQRNLELSRQAIHYLPWQSRTVILVSCPYSILHRASVPFKTPLLLVLAFLNPPLHLPYPTPPILLVSRCRDSDLFTPHRYILRHDEPRDGLNEQTSGLAKRRVDSCPNPRVSGVQDLIAAAAAAFPAPRLYSRPFIIS